MFLQSLTIHPSVGPISCRKLAALICFVFFLTGQIAVKVVKRRFGFLPSRSIVKSIRSTVKDVSVSCHI